MKVSIKRFKSHILKEHDFPVCIKYRPETANIKSRPLLLKTLISEVSEMLYLLKSR